MLSLRGEGEVPHARPRVKFSSPRALLLAAALLCGCARAAQLAPAPMTVDVPVPEPLACKVSIPARPALPIAALDSASPPADTIRAYAATVAVLKAAIVERDGLLHACTEPDSPDEAPAAAAAAAAPDHEATP